MEGDGRQVAALAGAKQAYFQLLAVVGNHLHRTPTIVLDTCLVAQVIYLWCNLTRV
jgi:hypothetical protein